MVLGRCLAFGKLYAIGHVGPEWAKALVLNVKRVPGCYLSQVSERYREIAQRGPSSEDEKICALKLRKVAGDRSVNLISPALHLAYREVFCRVR